eukprot:148778-Amphidinium_carterae.1
MVHDNQYGGMSGRLIATPIMHIARALEVAQKPDDLAEGIEQPDTSDPTPHWLTYDLTKAFDTIHPWLAC